MFYTISSSFSRTPNLEKPISSPQKAAISADVVLSTIALLGFTYAALSLAGINLGPLNTISSYLGQNGTKYLLAVSGGFLALSSIAAIVTLCRRMTVFHRAYQHQMIAKELNPPSESEKTEKQQFVESIRKLEAKIEKLKRRPTEQEHNELLEQFNKLKAEQQKIEETLGKDPFISLIARINELQAEKEALVIEVTNLKGNLQPV